MKRKYKQYLDHGDIGITKRTSRRHNLNCDNYLRNLGDMETEKANNLQRNISNEFIDEAPSIAFNEENHGNDNVDANYDNNDSERDVSFDNLSNMMDDVDDRESDIAFHNLSNIMDDVDDRERDIAFDNLRKIIDDVNIEQNNDLYLKPQSLETFINSKEFFEKITTRVDKSAGEIFLMLLKYSFNNTLCTTARTNLFKLINNIFESPILPESKYMTDKLLNPASECEYHAVCLHCSAYLGEFGSNELKDICDNCKHNVIVQNPSDESFFVLIDPSKQISDLLTINDEYYDHVTKTRIFEPASPIRDVYDGNLYRQFINSLSAEERCSYVTFVFNTDGASKFKCSKRSVWPIYLMLNELPKQERMKNLICCGLWFNRKKPDMTIFLDKFVDLMTKLKNKGILCKIKNEERVIKPYIISCCVDSVARAPVQGIKQFNGHFGCNWCLHPGVYHGTIVYSLMRNVVESRNHIDTVQRMLNFDTENPDFGIMYPSPFINLPAFDIIKSFIPDYMHCCLEGVAKQMLTYYINPLTDDEIGVLDSKMDKISAPHQVGRLTRRISCRDDWKAREWENFVLFYSTPILSSVLTKTQLDHWLLFVESLYILLQDSIYIKDLDRADDMLHRFVSKTEELYGIRAMTFNMHLLLHISRSVFNWGPLFVNSTFCFESAK